MFLELLLVLFLSLMGALGNSCEHACGPTETCCPGPNPSEATCCPFVNAVCCEDGIHCCPEGSFCDLDIRMCGAFATPQVMRKRIGDIEEEIPTTSFSNHHGKRDTNGDIEEVFTTNFGNHHGDTNGDIEESFSASFGNRHGKRDATSNIEDAFTTRLSNYYYGKGDTLEEEVFIPTSSNHNLEKRAVSESRFVNEITHLDHMLTHCNLTEFCPYFHTCCYSENLKFTQCCPNKEGVCCSDEEHCCRHGEECDSRGIFCLSEFGLDTVVRKADELTYGYVKEDLDIMERLKIKL